MAKIKKPEFVELHKDTIDEVTKFIKERVALNVDVKFAFVGSTKQKESISIKKVPKAYEFLYKSQILIIINEAVYEQVALDEEMIGIILEDGFSGLTVNCETGEAKIASDKFMTSAGVIENHGIAKVKDAKDLEKAIFSQLKEQEDDSADIDITD